MEAVKQASTEPIVSQELTLSKKQYVTKGDVQELKSLGTPPQAVKQTMFAVAILMGREPTWKAAQALLGNPGSFCTTINEFQKVEIEQGTLAKLEPYVRDLKCSDVKQSCMAAHGICQWVLEVCDQNVDETTVCAEDSQVAN